MNQDVKCLVNKYIDLYKSLKLLQTEKILSEGDQITGVIGEYYAYKYLESTYKNSPIKYSNTNDSYDIECGGLKYQVKSVSAYSKTRVIAPLNMKKDAFHYLILIDLDYNFIPVGFYINTYEEVYEKISNTEKTNKNKIIGSKMKSHISNPLKKSKGSDIYNFNDDNNLVNVLIEYLNHSI